MPLRMSQAHACGSPSCSRRHMHACARIRTRAPQRPSEWTRPQALSEAVSDSRAVVADAYDALQADGTLGRHEAGSVAAAVAAVWATGNDTLRDEARALVAEAHARGYAAFADVLPATPPPRSSAFRNARAALALLPLCGVANMTHTRRLVMTGRRGDPTVRHMHVLCGAVGVSGVLMSNLRSSSRTPVPTQLSAGAILRADPKSSRCSH